MVRTADPTGSITRVRSTRGTRPRDASRLLDTIARMQPEWFHFGRRGILMPSITIKNMSEQLLERLRRRAQEDKRSMNREAIHLLDLALRGQSVDQDVGGRIREVESQIRAWRRLAGLWDSDLDTADEIERIYAARTHGRRVDL